jgi:hypothetical protein
MMALEKKKRYDYPNGDYYEGDWSGHKKHGEGVFFWKAGA